MGHQLHWISYRGYRVLRKLNVLAVYWILAMFLTGERLFAFLGGVVTAIQPVFANIVPSITFREELIASAFGLLSLVAFMRFRIFATSPLPFYVFFALALFSKESALAVFGLALAYDVAHGYVRLGRKSLSNEFRMFAPILGTLIVYFTLRWIAFGGFMAGHSIGPFFDTAMHGIFHERFFRSIFHGSMFSMHGVPYVETIVVTLVIAAIAVVVLHGRKLGRRYFETLAFAGPLWYLCSTFLLGGVYFATRHNIVPILGLVVSFILLLSGLVRCWDAGRTARRVVVSLAMGLSAVAFLPPTTALSREWDLASGVVEHLRRTIEERTADLPPGSTILIKRVPQYEVPPHYFGWGLQSALKKPFSRNDLANVSLIVNCKNMKLNRYRFDISDKFDRVVDLTRDWSEPDSSSGKP